MQIESLLNPNQVHCPLRISLHKSLNISFDKRKKPASCKYSTSNNNNRKKKSKACLINNKDHESASDLIKQPSYMKSNSKIQVIKLNISIPITWARYNSRVNLITLHIKQWLSSTNYITTQSSTQACHNLSRFRRRWLVPFSSLSQ